jgi:hypothetical protein
MAIDMRMREARSRQKFIAQPMQKEVGTLCVFSKRICKSVGNWIASLARSCAHWADPPLPQTIRLFYQVGRRAFVPGATLAVPQNAHGNVGVAPVFKVSPHGIHF